MLFLSKDLNIIDNEDMIDSTETDFIDYKPVLSKNSQRKPFKYLIEKQVKQLKVIPELDL